MKNRNAVVDVNRQNGKLSGVSAHEMNRLRRVRELARMRCSRALNVCVDYWLSVIDDDSVPHDVRLRASENLANRGGLPNLTWQHNTVGEGVVPPKVTSFRHFEEPPSFTASMEVQAEAHVVPDGENGAGGGDGDPPGANGEEPEENGAGDGAGD